MKEDFEKELHEFSPFLADLKKQQKQEPFKTPRLYFDTLADKVLEKAKSETNPVVASPQYNSLFVRINSWLSMLLQPKLALSALGLVLVIAASWYVALQPKTTFVPQSAPSVTGIEASKNNTIEVPVHNNSGVAQIENRIQQNTVIESKEPKMGDIKVAIVDSPSIPKAPEVLKPVITHPKSGLTEEEIEEFLKDALVDEDLEGIGGK